MIYVFGNARTVIFRYLLTIFYRREHRPVPPGSSRDCRQYFYWGHHAASIFIVFIFITKMIKAPCFFLLFYLLKFSLIWFMTIRVKFYTEFLLNELFNRVSCLLVLFTPLQFILVSYWCMFLIVYYNKVLVIDKVSVLHKYIIREIFIYTIPWDW